MAPRLVCHSVTQEDNNLHIDDRPQSLKSGFKKPGKNGMNIYRAVLITGPPGIGKTTSAHLCAKLEGFTPIELNASDARSKKLVEVGIPSKRVLWCCWLKAEQHQYQQYFIRRLDGRRAGMSHCTHPIGTRYSWIQSTNVVGVTISDRSCLIMDEVDGMSAGDRGGVGALNALIKKTRVSPVPTSRLARVLMHGSTDSHHLYCKRPNRTETKTFDKYNV